MLRTLFIFLAFIPLVFMAPDGAMATGDHCEFCYTFSPKHNGKCITFPTDSVDFLRRMLLDSLSKEKGVAYMLLKCQKWWGQMTFYSVPKEPESKKNAGCEVCSFDRNENIIGCTKHETKATDELVREILDDILSSLEKMKGVEKIVVNCPEYGYTFGGLSPFMQERYNIPVEMR